VLWASRAGWVHWDIGVRLVAPAWWGDQLLEETAMRYDIDLSQGSRRWTPSILLLVEGLRRIVTSTPFIVLLMGIVVMGLGYFAIFVPFFRVSPVHKAQLRDLKLLQSGIEQQREGLMREAKVALELQARAAGWAHRMAALEEHLPDGLWLSRVALEEEQIKGARPKPQTGQGKQEPPRKHLVIEGRVDARQHPSPLEPISRYMRGLQEDPRIKEVVSSLWLTSSAATKEDPALVGFQVRGLWSPADPEKRLQEWMAAQGRARAR